MPDDSFDPLATGKVFIGAKNKAKDSSAAEAMDDAGPSSVNGIAVGQLRSIVERIERLEEEKKAIADDIKDVYGEAKGNGFDTKALRQIIRLRKQDAGEREEQEAILDLYKSALGMGGAELIPRDPQERAEQALAAADERIRKRRQKQAEAAT